MACYKTVRRVKDVVARLVLVVTYDAPPDTDEIDSLVESARALGTIELAELTYNGPVTRSFK